MPTIFNDITGTLSYASLGPSSYKAAAFRPGIGIREYWICAAGLDGGSNAHRRFYRSVDGGPFDFVTEWNPYTPGWTASPSATPYVSFVFTEDGHYIYAVTVIHEYSGATAHHYLVVGKYDAIDGEWDDSQLHTEASDDGLIWTGCDIDLDASWDPMVVGCGGTFTRFFYVNNFNVWTSQQITGGSVTPIAEGSPDPVVLRMDNTYLVHVKHGSTESYLYWYLFNINHPAPPYENWQHWVQPDMPNAQLAIGSSGLGFLRESSNTLVFNRWQGLPVMAGSETVSSNDPNLYAYGLCHRGGAWHAVYCSGTTNYMTHMQRSADGSWSTIGQYNNTGNWKYFSITKELDNPPEINENVFGVAGEDATTYAYDYILADDWFIETPAPGDNYWEYGDLMDSKIFAFDVDTGAVQTEHCFASTLRMIDIINVGDHNIFSRGKVWSALDVGMFLCDTDTFKDWYATGDTGLYANKVFLLTSGAVDGGNSYRKYAKELVADFDINDDQTMLITVLSDAGSKNVTVTNDNIGKPLRIGLWGRWFYIAIYEASEYDVGARSFDLSGIWTGVRQ